MGATTGEDGDDFADFSVDEEKMSESESSSAAATSAPALASLFEVLGVSETLGEGAGTGVDEKRSSSSSRGKEGATEASIDFVSDLALGAEKISSSESDSKRESTFFSEETAKMSSFSSSNNEAAGALTGAGAFLEGATATAAADGPVKGEARAFLAGLFAERNGPEEDEEDIVSRKSVRDPFGATTGAEGVLFALPERCEKGKRGGEEMGSTLSSSIFGRATSILSTASSALQCLSHITFSLGRARHINFLLLGRPTSPCEQ